MNDTFSVSQVEDPVTLAERLQDFLNRISTLEASLSSLDSESAAEVVYMGTFTTVGGDASEAISIPGVVATDRIAVTVKTAGATPRSIVAATAATDAINVTLSGDPSTDHVLQYIVFRAA